MYIQVTTTRRLQPAERSLVRGFACDPYTWQDATERQVAFKIVAQRILAIN